MAKSGKQNGVTVKYILIIVALLAIAIFGVEFVRRNAANSNNAKSTAIITNSPKPFPRELSDGDGEVFIVPSKPNRIVSQTLGTDEILLTICDSARIVALSSLAEDPNYSNIVEKAKEIPNRTTQGAEQILQMSPDLIFVASYSSAEIVDLLKASKAPVFRFKNFSSIEDIKNNISTVGYVTGCDEGAEKLVGQMNEQLAAIRARIPKNQNPPRVMSYSNDYTAGDNTTFNDMVRSVGAINISAEKGIDQFAKISGEKVAEWQPDFIIAGANQGEIENKRQQMLNDPIVKATKAGKAGHIIVIENRNYLAVTHHIVRAIETLFDGLYGNSQPNN